MYTLRHGGVQAWTSLRQIAFSSSGGHFLRVRCISTNAGEVESTLAKLGQNVKTDDWLNVPPSILHALPKKLHLQADHPLSITRQLIESRFPGYKYYNHFSPIVTTHQNFDSLSTPADHVSRSRSDTYYLNKNTVLRTHTSAHQCDVYRSNASEGFLIGADVYRRDEIDRSHYPIFHQMEGARLWDRKKHNGNVAQAVRHAVKQIPKHDIIIEDPNPTYHPERNPLQPEHTPEEVEAIATHLKRSLETVVVEIFSKARAAASASGQDTQAEEPLKVRWVEAYFPFTSPSWELEVWWQNEWLEVLGCGVILQKLLNDSEVPSQVGWAFGIGLERIAMLLFNVPDIRLFWSQDLRFLSQFKDGTPIKRFAPFSRYPECYKDVSFWLPKGDATPAEGFQENDLMEIVRNRAGDLVEDVRLSDEFTHPKTGRGSKCYRINYRSLERTLKNEEINALHSEICGELVEKMGVEIR